MRASPKRRWQHSYMTCIALAVAAFNCIIWSIVGTASAQAAIAGASAQVAATVWLSWYACAEYTGRRSATGGLWALPGNLASQLTALGIAKLAGTNPAFPQVTFMSWFAGISAVLAPLCIVFCVAAVVPREVNDCTGVHR